MKLSEVVELVENHPDLHPYLDKILKKNKKTQVSYLESLNHLEREAENQVFVYKKLLLSPLEQGEESTQKIRRRVHQRFLNGDSLEQKLAKIDQAPSPESEMERRLLYLTDLLKIHLFIAESTCEETDIQAKIEENMEILKKYIKEHEIYSLFPFKG